MIFFFLYQALFVLGIGPYLVWRFFKKKKIDLHLKNRFGRGFFPLGSTQKTIWIHAISLGEMRVAVRLYNHLQKRYPKAQFVVTSSTQTGLDEAKRAIPADQYGFLPFDLSFAIRSFLDTIDPQMCFFVEGDLWPNLLRHISKRGIRISFINAKISDRSWRRWQRFSFIAKKIFSLIDEVGAQSQKDLDRLLFLGCRQGFVTGNLKFLPIASESVWTKEDLGLRADDKVVVIGSTHSGEEKLLLEALDRLEEPIKVFVVPRHPERFKEIQAWLKEQGRSFSLWSQQQKTFESLVVVDQMGVLQQLYRVASVSIVAGSFVPEIGGHNILEPIFASCPVVFGPYMHNQHELVQLVLDGQAGIQVDLEHLAESVQKVLVDPKLREEFVNRGEALVQSMHKKIEPFLDHLHSENEALV